MDAMWKPSKFKLVYVYATLYVLTLTLPSAISGYWAFGDNLVRQNNVLYLLPRNGWRDTAVILMLLHQVRQKLHFFLGERGPHQYPDGRRVGWMNATSGSDD